MWRMNIFIRHKCGERKSFVGHRWFRTKRLEQTYVRELCKKILINERSLRTLQRVVHNLKGNNSTAP